MSRVLVKKQVHSRAAFFKTKVREKEFNYKDLESNDMEKEIKLTYQFSTNPTPIVVSPSNVASEKKLDSGEDLIEESVATISLVITNNTEETQKFNSINIYFPIGNDDIEKEQDDTSFLTNSMSNIKVHYNMSEYSYKIDIDEDNDYCYIRKCDKNDEYIDFDINPNESIFLVFRCTQISTKVGDFPIYIEETSKEDDEESAIAAYYFGKFPYGFFLDNFRAEPPVIQYGESTTLKWDGAYGKGFEYAICSNKNLNTQNSDENSIVSEEQNWEELKTRNLKVDNLTSSSVFTLRVRYKKYLGVATPSEYYLQTTVFVINSDINATNITAKNAGITNITAENIGIKGTLYVDNIKAYER